MLVQLTRWYSDVQGLDTERLVMLLSLGARVQKILEIKDKFTSLPGRRARPAAPTGETPFEPDLDPTLDPTFPKGDA